jgi:hypothetical protein
MKRLTFGVIAVFLLSGVLAFAETQTLIDFAALKGDTKIGDKSQNSATMVDFSKQAGASYTQEEKKEMKTSLALEEWDIELASSSRTAGNMRYSITKSVDSKTFGSVLGARIKFPEGSYNSYAIIRPPFEIPAYDVPTKFVNGDVVQLSDQEIADANKSANANKSDPKYLTRTSKFDRKGVIKNVATIKSIKVRAYGSNYPHGFGIRLKDQSGNIQDIFMGYLNFDGWKEIEWKNSNYIDEVRNRELRLMPLYPQADPYIKFLGLIVYRDGGAIGGDFVTYFKDVEVTYDKALLSLDRDIDDENAWGILDQREQARKAAETRRLGDIQVLRYLEQKKKHIERTEAATPAAAPAR